MTWAAERVAMIDTISSDFSNVVANLKINLNDDKFLEFGILKPE